MEGKKRLICGVLSRLLAYPDEEILRSSSEIEEAVKMMPEDIRGPVGDFLRRLRSAPLLALQEEYTRTFDLDPGVSLNLSYHRWGDDRQRSAALVELKRRYRDGGYEISGGELPDYLPMLLEFLAVCPVESSFPLYGEYGDQLAVITSRLSGMRSSYAGLFEALNAAQSRRWLP